MKRTWKSVGGQKCWWVRLRRHCFLYTARMEGHLREWFLHLSGAKPTQGVAGKSQTTEVQFMFCWTNVTGIWNLPERREDYKVHHSSIMELCLFAVVFKIWWLSSSTSFFPCLVCWFFYILLLTSVGLLVSYEFPLKRHVKSPPRKCMQKSTRSLVCWPDTKYYSWGVLWLGANQFQDRKSVV